MKHETRKNRRLDLARPLERRGVGGLRAPHRGHGLQRALDPEAVGRDPFSLIGYLAAKTEKLIFATGIANIYARDPMATKAIWKTVAELAPDRFILGLGVSHQHLVGGVRGHEYAKPLTTMRNYLEAMEKALYMGKEPEKDAPIVLGALRDKMLKLSSTAGQGAHPYLSLRTTHVAPGR